MNQLNERQMELHVKILGWIQILGNAVLLMFGLCGLLFFAGIGFFAAVDSDPIALPILGIIGLVALAFFSVLALPGMAAGYGLLKRKQWGRILALILGVLNLFSVPLGTLLGIYTLFVLLQEEAEPYFRSREAV